MLRCMETSSHIIIAGSRQAFPRLSQHGYFMGLWVTLGHIFREQIHSIGRKRGRFSLCQCSSGHRSQRTCLAPSCHTAAWELTPRFGARRLGSNGQKKEPLARLRSEQRVSLLCCPPQGRSDGRLLAVCSARECLHLLLGFGPPRLRIHQMGVQWWRKHVSFPFEGNFYCLLNFLFQCKSLVKPVFLKL